MAKKPLKPVDLSFLAEFNFVEGNGHYPDRKVCVMTGLHLAVAIAEGRTTLAQALDPEKRVSALTSVDCVSPVLRDLIMQRNDAFSNPQARKKWALQMLPRLLGTYRGKREEKRLNKILSDLVEEEMFQRIDALYEKYKKKRDAGIIEEMQEIASGESDVSVEMQENEELLDMQIETLLTHLQGVPA